MSNVRYGDGLHCFEAYENAVMINGVMNINTHKNNILQYMIFQWSIQLIYLVILNNEDIWSTIGQYFSMDETCVIMFKQLLLDILIVLSDGR